MTRHYRSLLSLGLALVASVAVATPAQAAAGVEYGSFSGTWQSTCKMPKNIEGPANGPYSCAHKATSTACAAVADTGTVTTTAKLCRADLTSGTTTGAANVIWPPYEAWTCANGSGSGFFRYQPSTSESLVFTFPVYLDVTGSQVVVTGSYTQAGTGRHIVVRATFPAVCAYNTSGVGYHGAVTPV